MKYMPSRCLVEAHWMTVFLLAFEYFIQSTNKLKVVGDCMLHTGLHLEWICQLPIMYDLAYGIVRLWDNGDVFWRKAIVVHEFPDDFSVYAARDFLEVNKNYVKGSLPFQ